ncbi:unnamed protein product [Caenorhabditis bovis]|uniref:Uncharacterized protein n=1 Tax=Caenorhabditis bovis TaxID=2654633 RepID=A0A8S1EWV2_9PELO|nr:unnamed protein product [Caenorhabditis bovis]
MSDVSMKKVVEVEDAAEVGPPRKRVKFYHFAEEVLFEVVEGPRKGYKRTRVNGPEIRKVKTELSESPTKRRRPKEVPQEEMHAAFGPDAEPVELDMTPHSYFCYRSGAVLPAVSVQSPHVHQLRPGAGAATAVGESIEGRAKAHGESRVGRDGTRDRGDGGAGATVGGEGGGGGVGEAEVERVFGGG